MLFRRWRILKRAAGLTVQLARNQLNDNVKIFPYHTDVAACKLLSRELLFPTLVIVISYQALFMLSMQKRDGCICALSRKSGSETEDH